MLIAGIWKIEDPDNPVGDYFEVPETEDYGDHIQFSVQPPKDTGVAVLEIRLSKEVLNDLAKRYL